MTWKGKDEERKDEERKDEERKDEERKDEERKDEERRGKTNRDALNGSGGETDSWSIIVEQKRERGEEMNVQTFRHICSG